MQHKEIPIWFFIGSLLAVYGVLILGYGLYSLGDPTAGKTVLAELHADIWWGALLLIIGAGYCIKFKPSRN
ncbi:MAG: hypothetical protein HY820_23550 [Acidobacteria bacterium]|nr:hypothetical protein [Acidobacteriota bacterium]